MNFDNLMDHEHRRLVLSGSKLDDEELKGIKELPISELELLECPNLTSACLSTIGKMPMLKTLLLGSNEWVNDEVLAKIPSNVETLSIATCSHFTSQGLANLTKLRSLDLFGCNHLQDDDFINLPDQLESLDLAMCRNIGTKTIQKLSSMPKLKHLSLISDPFVTDQFLEELPKSLVTLKVSGCSLTDDAFDPLSKMEKLEELALCSTKISGEKLTLLPKSLVRLHLDFCENLTDADIIPLASRKKLKYLGLFECPHINGDFLESFRKSEIETGWQPPQRIFLEFP